MKKLLFALVCALFTINVFADAPSCRVANSREGIIAVLDQTSKTADQWGQLYISVHLENTSNGKNWVNVLVNIYDAKTDRKVDTVIVEIGGHTKGAATFRGYEANRPYYFRIHSASCE